jgi:NAD(P)H-hydrate epimerase
MKILTASEMREVDRLTIESGIPGLILMENAGNRVVDFLRDTFAPLTEHRIVVICGKGNNGGDGFVVARQLFTRQLAKSLEVFELFDPAELTGDALANRKMLEACGCPIQPKLRNEPNLATIVVDAVLGSGLTGPARGPALEAIKWINERCPLAKKVAVDTPSGLGTGEFVKTDYTVMFTAAKQSQNYGQVAVYPIGSPARFYDSNPINLTTKADIRHLFAKRASNANKGTYGHVLVVGGSFGKSGAPAMAGLGSYRSGAGLVTVAVPASVLTAVAAVSPVLMTVPMEDAEQLAKKMTVLAVGPGLGSAEETIRFVKRLYTEFDTPAVVDADALNALAGNLPHTDKIRILTPHPGEMSRLTGKTTKEVQADRMNIARGFAKESGATVVLKGEGTIIAFPDGEAWVNPTGSPSMATGGTGDILTGITAGLVAQHPKDWKRAVVAAVWLHGRCGELGARDFGEQSMIATDLLDYLPEAMNELRPPV